METVAETGERISFLEKSRISKSYGENQKKMWGKKGKW
jgi:hypothetical protein